MNSCRRLQFLNATDVYTKIRRVSILFLGNTTFKRSQKLDHRKRIITVNHRAELLAALLFLLCLLGQFSPGG